MKDTADEGRINTSIEENILIMEVDRPAKLNGFTPEMFRQLAEAFTHLEHNDELRVGMVIPKGPHFSAGLDLPKFAPLMKRGEPLIPADLIDPFDLREPRRSKPIVLGLKGISYTLAVELAMAADIAIAGSDCKMTQIEVKRGVMATGGATIRMVERAGWSNAMRWLLTGDIFSAQEALRLNIVSEVVPSEAVIDTAMEIAKRIARAAPMAVLETRRNALLALEGDQNAASADFSVIQQKLAGSADAQEGVRAFTEKRDPQFKGE